MKRTRTALVVAAIAVPTTAVLVGGAFLILPPRQTADVPVPGASASPEEVAGAYIAALNAHDCDTAVALSTARASASAQSWCEGVDGLDSVVMENAREEDPAWSGNASTAEVVYVPVEFDLTWRSLHDDGSMPEGPHTWGYLLVREASSDPWRIADQGHG